MASSSSNSSVVSQSQESQETDSENLENPAKKRRYQKREIISKSKNLTDGEFVRLFCMNRTSFNDFVNEVAPYFLYGDSKNGMSLQPHERMLYYLKWAGCN